MDTKEINAPDGSVYGAAHDEFAMQHENGNRRMIINVNVEAEDVDGAEQTVEDVRTKLFELGFEIVPREETDIPTGDI